MQQLLPESRKLRVLLATVLLVVLNAKLQFVTPEMEDTLLQLVMVWIGGQSLADAGFQGKVLAKIRAARKGVNLRKPPVAEPLSSAPAPVESTPDSTEPDEKAIS